MDQNDFAIVLMGDPLKGLGPPNINHTPGTIPETERLRQEFQGNASLPDLPGKNAAVVGDHLRESSLMPSAATPEIATMAVSD